MSVTYEFVNPAGNLTLDESQLISHNPVLAHTGKGDLRATFEETRDLDDYAQRQDRVNVKFNGTTKWTGYIIGASHNERSGTTTIKADGIAKRLEETKPDYASIGGPVTYSNTSLEDAIRDYWGRTEFSNFSVTNQSTNTVATGSQIQSADTTTEWGNVITNVSNDLPFAAQNGNLELLQSSFTREGEDFDSGTDSGSGGLDSNYSDGVAVTFDSTSGDVTYNFDLNYTIPEDRVSLKARYNTETSPPPDINIYIDGTQIDTTGVDFGSIQWDVDHANSPRNGSGWNNGDLSGSVSVRFEGQANNSGVQAVDVVCLYDNKYSYFFDDDNGGNGGYLDGPELYPDAESIELDIAKTSYNIVEATATTTWNNTNTEQAIALSNDGGATYDSASDTTTHTVNFSGSGRSARTKFTHSRYGSRTTATPQTGFNGQNVQDYTLEVDLNDLVVIDSLELTRNHFDNLQSLHDYGNFFWVIEHDDSSIGNLVVSSFQEGDETRTSPSEWDNPQNKNPEVKAEYYFNSVYLEGAQDANGDRPTAEVSDSTAISNDGREIQVFLRDLSITTEDGATFRANSLLNTALSNNDLVGTVTSPPNMVDPGYARSIDFGEGAKDKTVEEVSLSQSNDELVATYDFTVRSDFGEEISKLKRDARNLENKV